MSSWTHFRRGHSYLMQILRLRVLFPSLGPLRQGKRIRNVVYTPPGWPGAQKADIYHFPKSREPVPVVLLLYGTAWTAIEGRWETRAIAKMLMKAGYAVVNASYRGVPGHPYPAPLDDIREAVRWMRSHAADYDWDGERIATFGYSSGGHLAALVALKDPGRDMRIQAVIAGGAPLDLTLKPGGDLLAGFMGKTLEEAPGLYRDASPVHHVDAHSPPLFLYQGTADRLVEPEHAHRMQRACSAHGVRIVLRWLPGLSHIPTFLLSRDAVAEGIAFLDEVVKPAPAKDSPPSASA